MKTTKQYYKSLKDLYTQVNYFQNEFCEDIPKNKHLRCKNNSVMKQVIKELKDLGD